jgi:hypothetical protein
MKLRGLVPNFYMYIHVSVSDFIYSHDLGRPIGGIYKSFADT